MPSADPLIDQLPVIDQIRSIIRDHGRMPVDVDTIPAGADLYEAGLSSHASVRVMLAVEDCFDLEFPDHMLTSSVFQSIASIGAAVSTLRATSAPS